MEAVLTHQLCELLLQSLVLQRALVEQVVGEGHVGNSQTEEHHQFMALGGNGHGASGDVL